MKVVNRCVLAAVVAATGLLTAPARAADVSPLLPAETESVVFVNVRQILDSDLIKKFALAQIKQALEGNDAQKTMKELGLDPLKDIDQVHGGLWGEDAQNMKGLFVIKGNFDLEKLMAAAEKQAKKEGDKLSIVKDGEYTLIKVTVENRPDPVYVSGADKNTIVIGTDKGLVTTAMKAAETKGTKVALKKDLTDLVGTMDAKASLYVAGVSSGKVGDIPPNPLFDNPEKLKKQLEKLKTSSMVLRVTGDVNLDIAMGMKDAEAADDFGATVDELLNKAKAFLPFIAMQNQNLKPVVNDISKSLKSKVEKDKIVITAKLSGDAIGKAAGTDD
jgi:hypothetical protein